MCCTTVPPTATWVRTTSPATTTPKHANADWSTTCNPWDTRSPSHQRPERNVDPDSSTFNHKPEITRHPRVDFACHLTIQFRLRKTCVVDTDLTLSSAT